MKTTKIKAKNVYQLPYNTDNAFLSTYTEFQTLGRDCGLKYFTVVVSDVENFKKMRVNSKVNPIEYENLGHGLQSVINSTHFLLNEIYKRIQTLVQLTEYKNLISCSYKLMKMTLYVYYKILEEIVQLYPDYREDFIRLNASLAGGERCLSQKVYVESTFFDCIKDICDAQSRTNRPMKTNICVFYDDLKVIKNELDLTENTQKTDSHYTKYLIEWDKFQSEILRVAAMNYTKLFSKSLVTCMERFMDQQLQIKIVFIEKRQTYLDEKAAATPEEPQV